MDVHAADLAGWEEIDGALEREYRCKDFAAAIDFVNRIADAAEHANHHPDIEIRWNRVKLRWRTHSQDAITQARRRDGATLGRSLPPDVLELHEADGAFERLEEWLRARGFFAPGGESLVADLYLGYGLSRSIRRGRDTAAAGAVPAAARRLCRPI